MKSAPVYVASLDPHGLFNALSALVLYVTCLSIMFLALSFDLWPMTRFPTVMNNLFWESCGPRSASYWAQRHSGSVLGQCRWM